MSDEFIEGVKIMLERMKTNPEEFDGLMKGSGEFSERLYTSRWGGIMARYWTVMTDAEKQAVEAGLYEANRHNFTAAVMDTLFNKGTHEHGEFVYEVSQGKLGHAVQGSIAGSGLGGALNSGVYNPTLAAVASSNTPLNIAKGNP